MLCSSPQVVVVGLWRCSLQHPGAGPQKDRLLGNHRLAGVPAVLVGLKCEEGPFSSSSPPASDRVGTKAPRPGLLFPSSLPTPEAHPPALCPLQPNPAPWCPTAARPPGSDDTHSHLPVVSSLQQHLMGLFHQNWTSVTSPTSSSASNNSSSVRPGTRAPLRNLQQVESKERLFSPSTHTLQ